MVRQLAHANAPPIANYNWNQHPNTLLVVQRATSSCGCTPKLSELALLGLAHDMDVLVATDIGAGEGAALRRAALSPRVTVVPLSKTLVESLCPRKQDLVMANIQHGRVLHTTQGGLPSEAFFAR